MLLGNFFLLKNKNTLLEFSHIYFLNLEEPLNVSTTNSTDAMINLKHT